jgi:hypothetical protein
MKLKISRYILDKLSSINFNEIPSSGSRGIPGEHTDGRTDMMLLLQYCEFV